MAKSSRPEVGSERSSHRASTDQVGLALTLVMAGAFLGFVVCGAFAPALMRTPLRPGGSITVAFVFGLGVIALGVVLTAAYVAYANRDGE